MKTTLALFAVISLALAAACTTSTETGTSNSAKDGATSGGSDAGSCAPALPTNVATFLNSNCMPCHSTANHADGIVLDTYAGVLAAHPAGTVADKALDEVVDGEMPLKFNSSTKMNEPAPLDAAAYAVFKAWVQGGKTPTGCD